MPAPELAVLVGLPGAGKSTFCRTRLAGTHEVVSRDLFPNHRHPSRRQRQLLELALAAGRSAALDNTNASRAERREAIEVARAAGARVVGYVFPPDVPGSRTRNAAREGRARVPDVAIYACAKRWETPTPDEGFDALFAVRPGDDRPDAGSGNGGPTFEVTPWEAP